MTDSLTRAAGTRWHHGPPGAAVALRAAAARRLPGSAAAEAVYLRAGIGLTRPADTQFTDVDCSSLVPAALYGCGLGGNGAPHRSVGDVGTVAGLELGLGYAVSSAVRLEALVTYPAALHVRWPRELPGPRPPAIRVRGSGRAVWDPGRVCRSPRIGVRPLGPFTLRTEGITRPVPHHRVAQEPADVNVIPARHDPRDQSVTGKGIVWKQAQDLVEYECC